MEHPLSRLSAFSLFRNTALSRMNLHLPFKPHLHSKLFLLYSCPSSSLSKAALHNAFNNQGGLIRRSFSGQCSIHIDCTLSSSSSSSPSKYFNHPSFKKPDVISWSEDMPVNDANLIGTIGREVTLQYLDSGKIIANTSIKVKRRAQAYSWFLVEFWGDLAEIAAAHLKKDSYVFIAGSVWVETFLGKDGVERKLCKVVANDLKFVRSMLEDAGGANFVHDISAEELWQDVFNNPSQWWDNRLNKRSPRHPDFKHKSSNQALWIDNYLTPLWVKDRLAMDLRKETEINGEDTCIHFLKDNLSQSFIMPLSNTDGTIVKYR